MINDGTSEFSQSVEVIGTEEIRGESYYKISTVTSVDGSVDSNVLIRKVGDIYETYQVVNSGGFVSDPYITHPLKDNVSVGETWTDDLTVVYSSSGTSFEIPMVYTYTVEAIHPEYEDHGTTYNNVLELKIHVHYSWLGTEIDAESFTFYALNIGPIRSYEPETGIFSYLTSSTLY